MNLVGNYKEWVTEELMSYLDSLTTGRISMKDVRVSDEMKSMYDYTCSNPWYTWFGHSEEIAGKNIKLPELPIKRKYLFWWIVRMNPGQFQPLHIDPHMLGATNPKRYTMFLQDYQPGHIFIYGENKMVTGYKAGDLFEWDDGDCFKIHAAGNISYNFRYSVQISLHDGVPEGDNLNLMDESYKKMLKL